MRWSNPLQGRNTPMRESLYKIYKYLLEGWATKGPGDYIVKVNGFPTLLSFGLDPQGHMCIWAKVRPDMQDEEIEVALRFTGQSPPHDTFRFIGTYLDTKTGLVWHAWWRK